jgi:hypothetical protein
MVLFLFFELFAEEQRRRQVPFAANPDSKPPPGNGIGDPPRS